MRERVRLSFNGLMLEKLVFRAAKRGVLFERVKRISPREAVLITDRAGADELLAMAREYSLDIRQLDCKGPGAVLRRARSRWTFFAAMALAGFLTLSFLSRVWIIDIRMLDGGDPSRVESALEDMGIVPGIRLSNADARAVQADISSRCASYAYIGARIQGVRLLIEATEVFPVPDVYDHALRRDILASMDAVVFSVDVLTGTARVVPGQFVKKGEVLIEGTERDGRESARGVNALGSVIGRAWLRGEAEAELIGVAEERTGRKSVKSEIRLWDYSYALNEAEGFPQQQVEEEFFPIGGIIAPLGIVKRTYYETRDVKTVYDLDKTRVRTLDKALENALSQAPDRASVFDKWTDSTIVGNKKIICRALVEIRLDIAADA